MKLINYFRKNKEKDLIKADFYISLGTACRPAYWLKKHDLRVCSNPLDWMMTYNLTDVIYLLKTNFMNFFENREIDLKIHSENHRVMKDLNTGMVSMHSFSKDLPDDKAFELFKEIMTRRFIRMDDCIKKSDSIAFVCNRVETREKLVSFLKDFDKIYKNKKLILINIRNSENESKKIYRISSKIKIIEIAFDDTNANGNEKSSNPNFWIGNEIKWNSVMKNLKISDLLYKSDANKEDLVQR